MKPSCDWTRFDIIICMFSHTISSLSITHTSSSILFDDIEFVLVASIHRNRNVTIWITFVGISKYDISCMWIIMCFVWDSYKFFIYITEKFFVLDTQSGRSPKYKWSDSFVIYCQIIFDQISTLIAIHLIVIDRFECEALASKCPKWWYIDHDAWSYK